MNPNTLQEIHDAYEFLNNLTAKDFTINTVTDSKNIHSVALCKFYDFLTAIQIFSINSLRRNKLHVIK